MMKKLLLKWLLWRIESKMDKLENDERPERGWKNNDAYIDLFNKQHRLRQKLEELKYK